MSILRRFRKRLRSAGTVQHLRNIRYYKRHESDFVKRKQALKRLTKRAEKARLFKLGKISEEKDRRRR